MAFEIAGSHGASQPASVVVGGEPALIEGFDPLLDVGDLGPHVKEVLAGDEVEVTMTPTNRALMIGAAAVLSLSACAHPMQARTCTSQAGSSLFAEPEVDGRLATSSPELGDGGRYAAFWLRIREGEAIRISAASSTFPPQIYVHAPGGGDPLLGRTVLGAPSADGGETSTVSLEAPAGGIYCVMVTRGDGLGYGAYRLRVDGPGYHPTEDGEVIFRDAE